MRGAMMLAQLYAQKGEADKSLRTLERIHQKIELVENIIELNALTVDLGDKFYEKQQLKEALACYRFAYPREQDRQGCKTIGSPRCSAGSKENLAAARASPTEITQLASANNQLKTDNRQCRRNFSADFEKLPSITPAIYMRLGALLLRARTGNGKRSSSIRKSSIASRRS